MPVVGGNVDDDLTGLAVGFFFDDVVCDALGSGRPHAVFSCRESKSDWNGARSGMSCCPFSHASCETRQSKTGSMTVVFYRGYLDGSPPSPAPIVWSVCSGTARYHTPVRGDAAAARARALRSHNNIFSKRGIGRFCIGFCFNSTKAAMDHQSLLRVTDDSVSSAALMLVVYMVSEFSTG